MEAVFCILYLVFTGFLGIAMLVTAKGNFDRRFFGLLTVVLVAGDAFHLVPRIYGALTNTMAEIYAALGFGTLVTSVTMTIFYVMVWEFWRKRRNYSKISPVAIVFYVAAVVRIALCFFPQNAWLTENPPLAWAIYRNIPFVLVGAIVVWRFWVDRKAEPHFKWAWLAITLSFAFYLPVVLFASEIPIVGMLMIPKTVCYVWFILMGYKATKKV